MLMCLVYGLDWFLVYERFLPSPTSGLDLTGHLSLNAGAVNFRPHPSTVLLSFKAY